MSIRGERDMERMVYLSNMLAFGESGKRHKIYLLRHQRIFSTIFKPFCKSEIIPKQMFSRFCDMCFFLFSTRIKV